MYDLNELKELMIAANEDKVAERMDSDAEYNLRHELREAAPSILTVLERIPEGSCPTCMRYGTDCGGFSCVGHVPLGTGQIDEKESEARDEHERAKGDAA